MIQKALKDLGQPGSHKYLLKEALTSSDMRVRNTVESVFKEYCSKNCIRNIDDYRDHALKNAKEIYKALKAYDSSNNWRYLNTGGYKYVIRNDNYVVKFFINGFDYESFSDYRDCVLLNVRGKGVREFIRNNFLRFIAHNMLYQIQPFAESGTGREAYKLLVKSHEDSLRKNLQRADILQRNCRLYKSKPYIIDFSVE